MQLQSKTKLWIKDNLALQLMMHANDVAMVFFCNFLMSVHPAGNIKKFPMSMHYTWKDEKETSILVTVTVTPCCKHGSAPNIHNSSDRLHHRTYWEHSQLWNAMDDWRTLDIGAPLVQGSRYTHQLAELRLQRGFLRTLCKNTPIHIGGDGVWLCN